MSGAVVLLLLAAVMLFILTLGPGLPALERPSDEVSCSVYYVKLSWRKFQGTSYTLLKLIVLEKVQFHAQKVKSEECPDPFLLQLVALTVE